MTDPFDQKPAHEEPTGVAASLRARRRLLKGAAVGLPAIMTLRSGAVLAAQSLTCLAKRTGSAEQGTSTAKPSGSTLVTSSSSGVDGSNVNWVRQAAVVYEVQEYRNGSLYGSSFKVYFDSVAKKWRKFTDGSVISGAGLTSDVSSLDVPYPPKDGGTHKKNYWTRTAKPGGYAIGWIDNDGVVQALGPSSNGLPSSTSCMTSIINKANP